MFGGKSSYNKKTVQSEEGGFPKISGEATDAMLPARAQFAKEDRLNPVSSESSNKENHSRDNSLDSDTDDLSAKNIREELKETKSKLKVMMSKFSNLKKEKENTQKENKQLQDEVMTLQSSLRQMIPGFANTSSSFPMPNELVISISEFYKYECEDAFFDLLCPELNIKGIILFFATSFQKLTEIVQGYFGPSEALMKKTLCLNSIDGPIMNVLRKSCQSTWRNIQKQCFPQSVLDDVVGEIQTHLKLGNCSQETNNQINLFLQKMSELVLCFYISDPPLTVNYKQIGVKINYNPVKHEPLDGFIKNKEECIIILPPIYKSNNEAELVTKALVLQVNYEIPN